MLRPICEIGPFAKRPALLQNGQNRGPFAKRPAFLQTGQIFGLFAKGPRSHLARLQTGRPFCKWANIIVGPYENKSILIIDLAVKFA